jgi:pSer/pThr/pTyr-binding forkhead associated (FHA) protein
MAAATFKVKLFDQKGTRVIPLAKSAITLGRASHCDVVFDHPSLQAEHVRAWLDGGRVWVQDLGGAGGTFLNGIRLPSLKPMLVRDVDALKLGEFPASIALETVVVRSPAVKSSALQAESENTAVSQVKSNKDGKDATAGSRERKDLDQDKRRDELAKLSRDLAEVRLQLQMARLEKTSSEDLRRQVQTLRDELKKLNDEKDQAILKREEILLDAKNEANEIKRRVESEVHTLRDSQNRKMEHWKLDALVEMGRQLHAVLEIKAKSWANREVHLDMLLDLENDITSVFRRVVMQEPGAVTETVSVDTKGKNKSTGKAESPARKSKTRKHKWAAPVAALVVGLGVGWLIQGNRQSKPSTRLSASVPASVRQQPTATRAPSQAIGFMSTYTETALANHGFLTSELNGERSKQWIADLSKTGRGEWKLEQSSIIQIASKEQQFLRDLQRIRQGSARELEMRAQMNSRESQFKRDLEAVLRQPGQVDRYFQLKRNFYARLTAQKP